MKHDLPDLDRSLVLTESDARMDGGGEDVWHSVKYEVIAGRVRAEYAIRRVP